MEKDSFHSTLNAIFKTNKIQYFFRKLCPESGMHVGKPKQEQYAVYYKYSRHYEWKKIPITDNVIAS